MYSHLSSTQDLSDMLMSRHHVESVRVDSLVLPW